jgi:threonine/homoserine/homoserine lactone efflux protein
VTLGAAVLGFAVVAAALTVTPGLDTALVLRAALTGRRGGAATTAAGIVAGLFVWGAAAAAGLSVLLTNLLNPKVGVFYVALLPQFLPPGQSPLAVGLLLAAVHGLLSLVWFGLLIGLAGSLGRWLRRPSAARAVDGVSGAALVAFGVRLALPGR